MSILRYSYFFRAESNTHIIAFKRKDTKGQGEDINATHIADSSRRKEIDDFITQLQHVCIEKEKTFTVAEIKHLWTIFPKKIDCTLDEF